MLIVLRGQAFRGTESRYTAGGGLAAGNAQFRHSLSRTHHNVTQSALDQQREALTAIRTHVLASVTGSWDLELIAVLVEATPRLVSLFGRMLKESICEAAQTVTISPGETQVQSALRALETALSVVKLRHW
jgi:hypothetical protein